MSEVHNGVIAGPMRMGAVFSKAVLATANIFAANLIAPTDGTVRTTVSFSVAAKLSATIKRGETTVTVDFNGGVNLVAGSVYIFDMGVREGDELNFQSAVSTTVSVLNADFIYTGA
jgi:CxxC motif-containing protein